MAGNQGRKQNEKSASNHKLPRISSLPAILSRGARDDAPPHLSRGPHEKQLPARNQHPLRQQGRLGVTSSSALVHRFGNLNSDENLYSGENMKFTNMQHIPLASAYLCPDCNCIGNCASQCPACASPVLMALAGHWLAQ